MKVNLTSQYRTLGGASVRIICIDLVTDDPYTVIGLIKTFSGNEMIHYWTSEGRFSTHSEEPNRNDLVEYNIAESFVMDQPIWVRYGNNDVWTKRHFHSYEKETNILLTWANGMTSFTARATDYSCWNQWSDVNPDA